MASKIKRLSKKAIAQAVKADYTLLYAPMPETWRKFYPVLTVSDLDEMGLHFTVNHTGKMSGMVSLSTTCKCGLCPNRVKSAFENLGIPYDSKKDALSMLKDFLEENPYRTDVSICGFCFSDTLQDRQKTMTPNLEHNFEILNNGIIHDDWIPVLNCLFFRGESFGDFNSHFAVINFYKIAAKNPVVNVTAWTKNLVFFARAEKMGYKKPENFKLIMSSQYINVQAVIPESMKHLVDAVFTVYTAKYAEKYGIVINCGARACLSCLRCYTNFDGVKYVNELLK